jgi:hypothetical protein
MNDQPLYIKVEMESSRRWLTPENWTILNTRYEIINPPADCPYGLTIRNKLTGECIYCHNRAETIDFYVARAKEIEKELEKIILG